MAKRPKAQRNRVVDPAPTNDHVAKKRRYVVGVSLVLLLAVFAAGAVIFRTTQAKDAAQAALRNQAYLVRAHSPGLGQGSEKVHIVEFMDPACSTCRSFYPLVKQMLATNRGTVRLSVRHVPFHPGSDVVVRALEASRAQDKYWQTLDALLSSQPRWVINHRAQPEVALAELDRIGLDMAQLRRDMDSPEVAQRIAQDLSDARALGVIQTPEFFVNGRPLPSFGYEQLDRLVRDELTEAS